MSILTNDFKSITFLEFAQRSRTFMPLLGRHVKSHAITWVLLIGLLSLIESNYRLAINLTPSLPSKVFVIHLHEAVETGDFIAFHWHGGKPYPEGYIFVKQLLASPGDLVIKHGRDFTVGTRILTGKEVGLSGTKLVPNTDLHEGRNLLQPGSYFVAGSHEYSLDSRYSKLGLVKQKDIIGRAYPIF